MAGLNPTREWALGELRRMIFAALGDRAAEVWLFGSCARGQVMQHSDIDIDIAVLPHDDLPATLLSELAADIEESPIPYDVDLVDLRYAAPALVAEVRREGVRWQR